MPKFRDHSLIPTEAVRLAALGLLAVFSDPSIEPLLKRRGAEMP